MFREVRPLDISAIVGKANHRDNEENDPDPRSSVTTTNSTVVPENADPLFKLQQWNTSRRFNACVVDWNDHHPRKLPRHPQGRCFVSDKYKLVYLLVPKAGSSTSRAICQKYQMKKTMYHQLTDKQKSYFTFAFWRDPLSRLPSAYSTLLSRSFRNCDEILRYAGNASSRDKLCKDMFSDTTGFRRFVGMY